MRQLPTDLENHLKSRTTTLCHCWRLQRVDGLAVGFTDNDQNLEFNNLVFEAETGLGTSEFASSTGMATDNSSINGALQSTSLNSKDIAAGIYDNAMLDQYLVNWSDVAQRILVQSGTLATVEQYDGTFQVEVRGSADALNHVSGRRYTKRCDAQLGDARCGVELGQSNFAANAIIERFTSTAEIVISGLDEISSGFFTGGFFGRVNSAETEQIITTPIRTHYLSGGEHVIGLWTAAENTFEVGDELSLLVGCDKQFSTCRRKFSNGLNFRGFPHVPGNDFALLPVKDGVVHDGSALILDAD